MTTLNQAADILRASRTIAILGAHHVRSKAAFYVPQYLHGRGYRVLPVNPRFVGSTLWGQPVVATLAELGEPVDMVDVFRRSQHLPEHLEELLAMAPLPRVVWFQLGIRHDRVATLLADGGIEVVQDRCTLADHRRAGLGHVEDAVSD